MASMTAMVDTSLGGAAEAFSFFGLANPFDWLNDVDGDPQAIATGVEQANAALEQLAAATELVQAGMTGLQWTGDPAQVFQGVVDGFVEGLKAVGEFVLWLVECVLQIIDYILELFQVILAIVIFVATVVLMIFVVAMAAIAALAASVVGSPGIPGVLSAAASAAWAAVSGGFGTALGAIALFAGIFALVDILLDTIVENLVDVLQGWREDLGGRIPGLPDWEAPAVPGVPVGD